MTRIREWAIVQVYLLVEFEGREDLVEYLVLVWYLVILRVVKYKNLILKRHDVDLTLNGFADDVFPIIGS